MDNFFRHWFRRESTTGIPSSTTDTGSSATPTAAASYEENIAYVSSQDVALRIATFYRCMELRANTMAQLTAQYQRMDRGGGNYVETDFGPYGQLNYLLQIAPNPLMTSFDMWRQVEIETVMRGNAFVLIERDDTGWPRHFWLAQLNGYNPYTDRYTLTYNGRGGQRTIVADSEDVLHFPNTFRRQNGYLGIATLDYARDMLSLSRTLDQEAMEAAAKGGKVKLILQQEKQTASGGLLAGGLVNNSQLKQYAQEVEKNVYNHDVIALHGVTNVSPISMSAGEMQLFEQRQFGVAEICRMMAVPRTLAMDGSNSSYKSPEADRLDFLMNCIQPKRRLLEDELNRKLLTPADFGKRRIHLCELPLMMFDKQGQATIDKMNLETGSMTVNEIRKQYDMPAVPGGDIVYVSTNLAELGSEKLRGASGTEPEPDINDEQPLEGGEQ